MLKIQGNKKPFRFIGMASAIIAAADYFFERLNQ
jgi:hypothetical protein